MSYILEAIKKADQKRKLGSVPDVHTVHEGMSPTARRLVWPYIMAVVLFVNAAIIVLWLQPWSGKVADNGNAKTPVVTKQIAKVEPPPSVPSAVKKPAKAAPQTDKLVVPAPAEDHSGESPAVAEVKNPLPKVETAGMDEDLPEDIPVAAPSEDTTDAQEAEVEALEPEDDLPLESLASTAEQPEIIERIGGQPLPDTNYAESDLMAEQKRQEEKEALAKIPYLRRMPADYRKDVPEIHISFHSYFYKPEKRLVSINGRIYREGEELKGGLKLEKITPAGVVISFKEREFRVKI
jgi:general secretion pathway protein B